MGLSVGALRGYHECHVISSEREASFFTGILHSMGGTRDKKLLWLCFVYFGYWLYLLRPNFEMIVI